MTAESRPDYYRITKDRNLVPHLRQKAQEVVLINYPAHLDQSKSNERQPIVERASELDPPAEINETPNHADI